MSLLAINSPTALVSLSAKLVADVDGLVGPDQRSSFIEEAAQAEVRRRRMLAFLEEVQENPVMKDEDHPEFADGTEAWVRKLRAESDKRVRAAEAAWHSE